MMEYLAESILISFTIGAIMGGLVATHLASRGKKPVIDLLRETPDDDDTLARKVRIRND